MGNSCTTTEDQGMSKMAQRGVGNNTQGISDDLLNAALPHDTLKQKVGITIECTNLPNLDFGSKTDAFCVLWQINPNGQQQKLGQTEVVADSLNPVFVTSITVDYYFEQQQNLRVDVYDADDATQLSNLSKHDFVGSYEFHLGKLVSSRNQELKADLENRVRKSNGQIKVMALEKKADFGKTQVQFVVSANVNGGGSANFLVISRFRGPGQYQPILKSETKP